MGIDINYLNKLHREKKDDPEFGVFYSEVIKLILKENKD